MNELIKLVNKLKRQHYICEDDCWYSCPLAVDEDGDRACCNDDAAKCNCGTDKHNALVDEVIKRLTGDESITFVCPDCQRVTVDMADVKALEADNERLRNKIMHLETDNVELLLLRDMEHERCRAERQEADNIRASRLAIIESLDAVMRERDLLKAALALETATAKNLFDFVVPQAAEIERLRQYITDMQP